MNLNCYNDYIDDDFLNTYYNQFVDDILFISDDSDYVRYVIELDQLMFNLSHDKIKEKNYKVFNRYIHKSIFYKSYRENCESPYVSLFFKILENYDIDSFLLKDNLNSENLFKFLDDLKQGMKEKEFKKEITNQRKAVSKLKVDLEKHIREIFEYRSRVLVIRLDAHYVKLEKESKTSNPNTLSECSIYRPDGEAVVKHRENFIKAIRKLYKKDLIGYVWKIEYGVTAGFHIHFLFFLDGSKHQSDIKIGKMLGEIWKEDITQGKGRYWNCNNEKAKFEKNNKLGIGMIHRDDEEKIKNLNQAASYLVKLDRFVKARLPKNNRAYGKSGAPSKTA
jgi:hypothetical protein